MYEYIIYFEVMIMKKLLNESVIVNIVRTYSKDIRLNKFESIILDDNRYDDFIEVKTITAKSEETLDFNFQCLDLICKRSLNL